MIPSLLAGETRAGVLEYLTTTFALADDEARAALRQFLEDREHGIFRGPYLRLRTPFRSVDEQWRSPLGWLPRDFRPHIHQARAFERLSTDGRNAQPTIVTTGTGSGKTESFLIPILDHCRRARERGEDGIKAILLYPMNALVTDQARRIARLLHDEPALTRVTAGVYIGGTGTHAASSPEHLVDRRDVLREHPPDILLTNYKMLDFLLLRREDAVLWQRSAASLRFVILDEFHTYDGAQGTDVAMLFRRLGATLRVAEPGRPLGRVVPVATSATLGSGTRREDMRVFAERVFGTPFDADALIGEDRLDPAEVVDRIDFTLPVPKPDEVVAVNEPAADEPTSWAELAAVFAGHEDAGAGTSDPPADGGGLDLTDPVVLGERLRTHFITRAALQALSATPLTLRDAVDRVAEAGVLSWGVRKAERPDEVAQALLRFLALLSYARVRDGAGNPRPLLQVEVQLWIREIRRMLRAVDTRPEFTWWHDGALEIERTWLPAAYCRHCGRSGWQAVAPEVGNVLRRSPLEVWQASVRDRARVRTLLLARDGEADVRHLVTSTLELLDVPDEGTIPVLATPDAEAAADQRCPACGADDAVRFLGSSVATLVSVALTQLFGSDLAANAEKKTLVFTDSVQDAAHRAAFIEGRAFQFNLRSVLLGAIGEGPTSLHAVARRLAGAPAADLYAVTPPDFPRRLGLEGEWLHRPTATLRRILNSRLAFQAQLEFGLRSRLGRTLELTGAVAVDYDVDLDKLALLTRAVHEQLPERGLDGLLPEPAGYVPWLWGLLDRLRTGGGIMHDSLVTYLNRDGDRYPIWGGSRKGMPKFPRGMAAPTFFTSGSGGRWRQFAALNPAGDTATWLTDWTVRCLGVPAREGKALLLRVAAMLAGDEVGVWARRTTGSGAIVYGWDPERILLLPVEDDALAGGRARVRCGVCRYVQPVAPHRRQVADGAPCPRFRCPGALAAEAGEPSNFYRGMYRSGRVRRIVTHEHTGLLDRALREDVERRFKANSSPIDPNILACTPTLELGIDIGDLGVVTLASLPRTTANYLQRVGRAGRATGNALVLAGVPSGPRDLYYFAEPSHLLDGEVTPPGAYLNATELLYRQFFAYCLDRVAAGDLVLPSPPPNLTGQLVRHGLDPGGWMRRLLDAIAASAAGLADGFLGLFGPHLDAASLASVHQFAAGGVEGMVSRAFSDWLRRERELGDRLVTLQQAINDLERLGHLDDEQKADRRRWIGERKAVRFMLDRMRDEPLLTGLEQMGLLPNYTLIDDRTVLDVSLWWTTDDGEKEYQTAEYQYERGSMTAVGELAPGAAFYARGQRIRIDAVDIGPLDEPLWQAWRLCPNCGWGTSDADAAIVTCPRCGGSGVSDTGAVHRMLPLRRVSALHSRDDSVIDDDADDRERVPFTLVSSVDVDPEHVTRAWRLRGVAFGAEYVRRAVVRRINVGPRGRFGQRLSIAGEEVQVPRFPTCVYCGVVNGSQTDNPRGTTRHRGWCVTRGGASERWEDLLLHHDLATQAVRLLLPVSTLRVQERLVSFTGALLLGLRHDFGGDPQHLRVVAVSMPDRQGGTRRYLVLHDMVPGGTGYLDRVGDPDRLRALLTAARTHLTDCPCRLEGRAACHRCLLGVVESRDVEYADRAVALDLLGQVLDHWDVDEITSVADITIDQVELTEIEQRFAELVRRWVAEQASAASTATALAGPAGRPELDIRLRLLDDGAIRWRMQAQVPVDLPAGRTIPDFLFTRQDAQGLPIAVYLDGRRYHASVEHNLTDRDARQRRSLRAAGYRVWSLTWDDVEGFARMLDDVGTGVDVDDDLVDVVTQNRIRERVADPRLPVVWGNPMTTLVTYLTDPEAALWTDAAVAAALALVASSTALPSVLSRAGLVSHLAAAVRGVLAPGAAGAASTPGVGAADTAGGESGSIVWAARASRRGCPLYVMAERGDVAGTVGLVGILDDRDVVVGGTDHRVQWMDWLRWANLAQFLPRPRSDSLASRQFADFATVREADTYDPSLHPLAVAPRSEPGLGVLPAGWELVWDLVDPTLRPLALLLVRGRPDLPVPEPGWEVGPDNAAWQLELAWPDDRVAVVLDAESARDAWLDADGWLIVPWQEETDPGPAAAQIIDRLGGRLNKGNDREAR